MIRHIFLNSAATFAPPDAPGSDSGGTDQVADIGGSTEPAGGAPEGGEAHLWAVQNQRRHRRKTTPSPASKRLERALDAPPPRRRKRLRLPQRPRRPRPQLRPKNQRRLAPRTATLQNPVPRPLLKATPRRPHRLSPPRPRHGARKKKPFGMTSPRPHARRITRHPGRHRRIA